MGRASEGRFALQHVDLHVPAGTTLALVGRTGSGKSTLASLLSRAVEPERGSMFLGGVDVLDLELQSLRSAVGVVTQRTEILAGTLAENVALFEDVPRARIEAAVVELGLDGWVAGLSDGLDTLLGPGGTTLSAGEEQLVAFARLLVRDVSVVVLDEATARMDPVTEANVVRAADRLLSGRTGLLVAHRLSTTERAEQVAVLDAGRVVQRGPRAQLASEPGPFRSLLEASDDDDRRAVAASGSTQVGTARRVGAPPAEPVLEPVPGLARATTSALLIEPQWGMLSVAIFLASAVCGAFGAVTGWIWGHLVVALQRGDNPTLLTLAVVVSLLASPLLLAEAIRLYPRWWIAVMLRVRTAVLAGQTEQHRLRRTPPGEVVARTMDADRLARYADRWVDFCNGLAIAVLTAVLAQSLLAGGVLLAVMVASSLASSLGRPVAGRSAAASAAARARFGRSLVSALDSIRTVKLAASTPSVHAHLREVDGGRVDAAVREHRVQALLDGVPIVMVQCGVVAAWGILAAGGWGLATALLVAGAVNGFDWFGRVAGAVITEAPGTRAWMQTTSRLAGGGDLMHLPQGVDLVRGVAPAPGAWSPGPAGHPGAAWRLRHPRRRDDRRQRRRPDGWLPGAGAAPGPGRLGQVQPALGAGRSGLLDRRDPVERRSRPATVRRSCAPAGSPTSPRCRGSCPAPSPTTSASTTPTGSCCRRSRAPGCCPTSRAQEAPTPWSATAASGSPAVRSSASRWPAASPATPSSSWPTTSRPPSTPPPRSSSGRPSAPAGRPSSAPPASAPPSPRPTAWSSSSRAGSRRSGRGRSSVRRGDTSPDDRNRPRCSTVGVVEGTALQAVLAAHDVAACISYSWFSVRWTSAQLDVFSSSRAQRPRHVTKGNDHGFWHRQVVQR